jgi:hypothetical protein
LVIDPSGFGSWSAVPVSTANGKWVELDMNLFVAVPIDDKDEVTVSQTIEQLTSQAQRYWRAEQSGQPFGEVLAEKLWRWTAFIRGSHAPDDYLSWRSSRQSE